MTDKKPEWFEIAEQDGASESPVRPRRTTPVIALVATLAILGTGAVVAQIGEEENATAETPSLSTGKVSGTQTPAPTESKAIVATPKVSSSSAPRATTPADPSPDAISNPLTNGGGERGEHEEHEGFGDGDGDHPRPPAGAFGKHGPRPPHHEEGEGDDD